MLVIHVDLAIKENKEMGGESNLGDDYIHRALFKANLQLKWEVMEKKICIGKHGYGAEKT